MVTVGQLRDVKPGVWVDAARGWREFACQSAQASADIRSQVIAKVETEWKDSAGSDARTVLGDLANEYDSASDLMNGVVMVLVGLGDAVEVAQQELSGALRLAEAHHLLVNDDGSTTPVDAGDKDAAEWKAKLDPVFRDALRAATEADGIAAQEFHRLAGDVKITNPDDALKEQTAAAQDEIAMIRDSLPRGQSPEAVRAWWNSLSDKEKTDLERAVPVELAGLDGIPADVKKSLRGSGPLDRVALVQYAAGHWNDPSTDFKDKTPSNHEKDNCANYVSTSLAAAGMPESESWTNKEVLRELHNLITGDHDAATPSWGGASALHDYLLKDTFSEVVPRQDARPGDVVFWSNDQDGIHHVAVVTSVTPDGDIHYSQHSEPAVNASMNGRARVSAGQPVTFVRVDPRPAYPPAQR
ncbi:MULTISPECIES: amidase domain-containing protein [Amycolatopsis]|uniref:Amidase domain-containing protein n=1 Tax=Amycolatopsis albidoflavus TaxID=102226 RepID=A0ABW5HXZ3_9PSEU